MIIISDLHCKNTLPHLNAIKSFLNFIANEHPNDEIIQLGDLWDTSSPFAEIEHDIIAILKKFKHLHIISGNHDQSRRAGNSLLHLNHHDNITVYSKMTETTIEGSTCLMLPYIHNAKKEYEDVSWKGMYMFAHITNEEDAFGEDGVNTDKIKATQFFGHTHVHKIYNKGKKIVVGVPLPTRNGEQINDYYELTTDGSMIKHVTPIYFEYQDIEYGQFPKNKNNILSVKSSPSYQSVWEMYKGYNIRKEGIEVLRSENDALLINNEFESGNILDKFATYSKEKKLPKEVHDCANRYLQEVM